MLVFSIESKESAEGGQDEVFPLRCEISLYEFTNTLTRRVLSQQLTLGPSNALPVATERGHFHLVLNSCVSLQRGEPYPVDVSPCQGVSLQPTSLFDSQGTFRVARNHLQERTHLFVILSLAIAVVITLAAGWLLRGSKNNWSQNKKAHKCKQSEEGRLVDVCASGLPPGKQRRSHSLSAAEICMGTSGSSSDSDSDVCDSDTTVVDNRHKLALLARDASKSAYSNEDILDAEIQSLDAELALYHQGPLETETGTPTRGPNVHITADNDEELLDELAKRLDDNDDQSLSSSSDEDDFMGTSPLPADNAAWRRWFDEHGELFTCRCLSEKRFQSMWSSSHLIFAQHT